MTEHVMAMLSEATGEAESAMRRAQADVEIARQQLQNEVKNLELRVQEWMDLKRLLDIAIDDGSPEPFESSAAPATAPEIPHRPIPQDEGGWEPE
jgi:hypothetical protein